MANTHTTLTSLFTDIANAIRTKSKTSDPIKADDFPTAIDNIKGGSGNAQPSEVLVDKTFTNDDGEQIGTMPNIVATTATIEPGGSYTIPAGYHNGSGKVNATSFSTDWEVIPNAFSAYNNVLTLYYNHAGKCCFLAASGDVQQSGHSIVSSAYRPTSGVSGHIAGRAYSLATYSVETNGNVTFSDWACWGTTRPWSCNGR